MESSQHTPVLSAAEAWAAFPSFLISSPSVRPGAPSVAPSCNVSSTGILKRSKVISVLQSLTRRPHYPRVLSLSALSSGILFLRGPDIFTISTGSAVGTGEGCMTSVQAAHTQGGSGQKASLALTQLLDLGLPCRAAEKGKRVCRCHAWATKRRYFAFAAGTRRVPPGQYGTDLLMKFSGIVFTYLYVDRRKREAISLSASKLSCSCTHKIPVKGSSGRLGFNEKTTSNPGTAPSSCKLPAAALARQPQPNIGGFLGFSFPLTPGQFIILFYFHFFNLTLNQQAE